MRFLITGVAGFAGRHLAAALLARGDLVFGTLHRPESRARLADLSAHTPARGDDAFTVVDIADAQAVADLVAAVQPDGVFHLAGVTFVPDSVARPAETFRVNVIGAINLFAAVQRHRPACRVLAVGSGDAYGAVEPGDLPVREDCPFRPLTPYGASKAAADLVAYQWARGAGLNIVRARPFNHTGPGQRPDFVCADFARQLVAIERGACAPLVAVGDLEIVRDFSDVRDVVEAYIAAWERGACGEAYNVCSGVGRPVRDVLDTLIELSGVTAQMTVAPQRRRRAQVAAIVGSAEKLRAATGWTPRRAWRDTLASVLDDWRRRA